MNAEPQKHPIYVRKGIIPELAIGLQSASSMNQP
jgi:hypothetical protein